MKSDTFLVLFSPLNFILTSTARKADISQRFSKLIKKKIMNKSSARAGFFLSLVAAIFLPRKMLVEDE